jgi:DNA-binding SARP family transcriptional activator
MAVQLLEAIGTADDIPMLRQLSKTRQLGAPSAGRDLARRLAPRIYVEDLGRFSIRIANTTFPGTDVRRKVLALLGYLLTRPQFSATRDQILEALWPDLEPGSAANSLNQTCYFLRRVLEPEYDEETSPGYLCSKGELIWLDQDLVTSRSAESLRILADLRRGATPDLVGRLSETYTGRFATDFLYDDWAAAYRENLHAAFLGQVERSITADIEIGAFDRGISIAQSALMADPDADQIELHLLRLYRLTGAHTAAAEQYAHYATVLREQLGVEPPPLDSI